MKQGKHIAPKRVSGLFSRKSSVLISLLLIAVFAVSGTLAYIITNTAEVENKFTPSSVPPEIIEVVDDFKKEVTIKNTGNADAYIRVAVVANTIDKDGNVTGPADVSEYLGGENWSNVGDYWYYTKIVAGGASTGDLVKEDIPLEGIQVIVMTESIQADGTDAYGNKPVELAWGDVRRASRVAVFPKPVKPGKGPGKKSKKTPSGGEQTVGSCHES